jgi:hypothetical protein
VVKKHYKTNKFCQAKKFLEREKKRKEKKRKTNLKTEF